MKAEEIKKIADSLDKAVKKESGLTNKQLDEQDAKQEAADWLAQLKKQKQKSTKSSS